MFSFPLPPFSLILLITGVGAYVYVYQMVDYTMLNGPQKSLAASIRTKWMAKMDKTPEDEQNIVTLAELKKELNIFEGHFADRILSIPAKDLGFKGQYYGMDDPGELVKIPNVVFDVPNATETFETGAQYYPKKAQEDFERMVAQMRGDIGKEIYNDSGYRSPGKQAYLFFKYLADESEEGNTYSFFENLIRTRSREEIEEGNKYSLLENAKWIALPGYSEHGSGKTPAFDFALSGGDSLFVKEDGTKMTNEETAMLFEQSDEYRWMQEHAGEYHFVLSYPRGNAQGVNFEPWHWRWEKKD